MKGVIEWLKKLDFRLSKFNTKKDYTKNRVNRKLQNLNVKLLVTHRSENSILDNPGECIPFAVGGRIRYATCSGVAWFDEHHLAVINLYGQHARIYKIISTNKDNFEPNHLSLVHEFKDNINFPEDISISKNKKYAAITNTLSDTMGVSVFEMDPVNLHFKKPLNRVCLAHACHGVQFSPDSKYLVFTIISPPGSVETYSVSNFTIIPAFSFKNPDPRHRPKSVCFTPDSKFIAILYSYAAGHVSNNQNNKSRISIHRYLQDTGKIEIQSVAQYIHHSEKNSAFEILAFSPEPIQDQYSFYVTDQEDKVFEFEFDAQLFSIEPIGLYDKDIPFPHGIDTSPDGNFLAVTTLGDDSIRIFELDNRKDTISLAQGGSKIILPQSRVVQ